MNHPTLSPHQTNVLMNLLSCPDRIVTLSGAAGTGKTTTIADFILDIPANECVALTSTTHQALSVLNDFIPDKAKCNIEQGTIHSFLGYTIKENYGKTTLVKSPNPSEFGKSTVDWLIIDEVSMLVKLFHDHMLKDEFKWRVLNKVIYIGDPVQLQIDPFLDLTRVKTFELTENHRQDKQSDLYNYCMKLRKEIESNGSPVPLPVGSIDIVQTVDHEEFLYSYKNSLSKDKVILAFKNSTVSSYNSNVKKYFMKQDKFTKGDKLICLDPVFRSTANDKPTFFNRERVEIVSEVTLESNTYEGITIDYFSFTAINKSGKLSNMNIPVVASRLKEALQILADSKDWASFYRLKKEFSSVHHSYAMTVHSAQGTSIDEVFIDLSDFVVPNDPMFHTLMRLVYVSLTRARKRATVFVGTTRDYTKLKD